MEILISDRDNAPSRMQDFAPTHCISFTTRPFHGETRFSGPYQKIEVSKKTEATVERLQPMIDFIYELPADARLFICCDFGVTRSATAALITCCIHGDHVPPSLHYDRMRQSWPRIIPQRGMIRVADALLGYKGALEKCMFEDTRDRIGNLPALSVMPEGPVRPVAVASRASQFRRSLRVAAQRLLAWL